MATDNNNKVLNVPNLRFPEFTEVWKDSNIGKCFDLYSGNTPSRMEKKHFIGDVNWITSGELKEHYIGDTKERISEKAAEDNNLRILPVGTFVMAIYGLEAEGVRGTCSITVKTSTISQACMAFTPKSNVSNEFLYSWYKKHGNKIGIRYAQGTKQQNLSYDIIEKFPIRYPSIEEQEKLNTFISLLDKRIATLEDLKKLKVAIIEKVFSEKKCNYKIGDVISQVSIRNKSKKETNILSVSNKWGFVEQSEQFEDRIVASEDITNYKVVRTNDFAYNPARINVGSIARLKRYESGIVSPMYICFHSQNALLPEYLELFFYTLYFKHEMYKRLEGSVRLCLSFEGLTNIPIFIPEITTQREISIKVNSIETKIGIEETYLNALKDQKQYLLKHMFI